MTSERAVAGIGLQVAADLAGIGVDLRATFNVLKSCDWFRGTGLESLLNAIEESFLCDGSRPPFRELHGKLPCPLIICGSTDVGLSAGLWEQQWGLAADLLLRIRPLRSVAPEVFSLWRTTEEDVAKELEKFPLTQTPDILNWSFEPCTTLAEKCDRNQDWERRWRSMLPSRP